MAAKTKKKLTGTEEVNAFMKKLRHPFKAEVEVVRKIILGVNKGITEQVKWAAPSFSYNDKGYLVTFNLWEKKRIHLVFHHPAIVKVKSPLLEGDYPTRRMTYFSDMQDIREKKASLVKVLKELIKRADT